MGDSQTRAPDPSGSVPLSLKAFAASLYHAERADNSFKFLKNFSEEDLASFVQGLLRQVGDAIDDGSTDALARFVEQGQVAAYVPTQTPAPFRPDFPDAPFAPLRKPLREATVALFSSGAIAGNGRPRSNNGDVRFLDTSNERTSMSSHTYSAADPYDRQ